MYQEGPTKNSVGAVRDEHHDDMVVSNFCA